MWPFNKKPDNELKQIQAEIKQIELKLKQSSCNHKTVSFTKEFNGWDWAATHYKKECAGCGFSEWLSEDEYFRSKYDQAKKELNKHYESKAKIKADNDAYAVRETIPKQL